MNNLDLKQFNLMCDEMLDGKYILLDVKLSNILKSIDESANLLGIVNNCVVENPIDMQKFIEKAAEIKLSSDNKEIVSFCYNLIKFLANQGANFYDFLTKFFGYEEIGDSSSSFKKFAIEVVLPFKEAINCLYNEIYSNEENVNTILIFNNIKTLAISELENIEKYNLKPIVQEELSFILKSFILCCERQESILLKTLMISLEYFCKANKKLRPLYQSFEDTYLR